MKMLKKDNGKIVCAHCNSEFFETHVTIKPIEGRSSIAYEYIAYCPHCLNYLYHFTYGRYIRIAYDYVLNLISINVEGYDRSETSYFAKHSERLDVLNTRKVYEIFSGNDEKCEKRLKYVFEEDLIDLE